MADNLVLKELAGSTNDAEKPKAFRVIWTASLRAARKGKNRANSDFYQSEHNNAKVARRAEGLNISCNPSGLLVTYDEILVISGVA
jgi:hypothetical protein